EGRSWRSRPGLQRSKRLLDGPHRVPENLGVLVLDRCPEGVVRDRLPAVDRAMDGAGEQAVGHVVPITRDGAPSAPEWHTVEDSKRALAFARVADRGVRYAVLIVESAVAIAAAGRAVDLVLAGPLGAGL